MARKHPPADCDAIACQAIEWFVRLHANAVAPADHELFAEWLRSSPGHVDEYLRVTRSWGDAMPPDDTSFSIDSLVRSAGSSESGSNVVALRFASATPAPASLLRTRWRLTAVAASAIFAIGALVAFSLTTREAANRYATGSGELKRIVLNDLSVVQLNTASRVRIVYSAGERRVELLAGEARFDVAKNPSRPFVVATAKVEVRAVGTVFSVRDSADRTAVTVLEGRVEVRGVAATAPSHRMQLGAGQRAAIAADGAVRPDDGPTVDQVRGWSEARLVFREETLADVVAEFNRYNVTAIAIDDPRLAAVRINGTFDANDPASFVQLLKQDESLTSSVSADGTVRLTRKASSAEPDLHKIREQ